MTYGKPEGCRTEGRPKIIWKFP